MAISYSSFSLAADECIPNLINEDMCAYAVKLVNQIKRDLPVDLSNNIKLTDVKAERRKLIFIVTFPYDFNVLKDAVNNDKNIIEKSKIISRETMDKTLCTSKATRAFINLGGEIQYDSFFSDGISYDSFTVTSCE